jgi:hypothetical protein
MSPAELVAAFCARFEPLSEKHVFNRSGMVGALALDDIVGVTVAAINGCPVKSRTDRLEKKSKLDSEQAADQANSTPSWS